MIGAATGTSDLLVGVSCSSTTVGEALGPNPDSCDAVGRGPSPFENLGLKNVSPLPLYARSIRELSRVLGYSRGALNRLVERGRIKRSPRGFHIGSIALQLVADSPDLTRLPEGVVARAWKANPKAFRHLVGSHNRWLEARARRLEADVARKRLEMEHHRSS